MAFIFQVIILVLIHITFGYNPDPEAKQTALAIWGIRVHMALIPAILAIVAFFIVLKWYDLKGEKKQAIQTKMKEMGL
jgi:Na+/melibiose symporter-like transporter